MLKTSTLSTLAKNCISEIQGAMDATKTNASGKTSVGLFSDVSNNSTLNKYKAMEDTATDWI